MLATVLPELKMFYHLEGMKFILQLSSFWTHASRYLMYDNQITHTSIPILLQALEEQFPYENGYRIHYDTFKFEAEELHIEVITRDQDQCVITLQPMTAKVRSTRLVCMYAFLHYSYGITIGHYISQCITDQSIRY